MTSFTTSRDGTKIAFDRLGAGPSVVIASGMFCARPATQPLAEQLAERFTVFNYDRRGRGESDDTAPYAVAREVDDLAALVAEAGGTASVYGHSSGAGLALHAAAQGVPIARLVLHEPPWGDDDEQSRRDARALADDVSAAIADDRRADAIKRFMRDTGMPADMLEGMSREPGMQAIAPTMVYDLEVMGDFTGGSIPAAVVRAVDVPTLVVAGGASPDFFRDTAERLVALMHDATLAVLDGCDHSAPAEVVAPVVAEFFTRRSESR